MAAVEERLRLRRGRIHLVTRQRLATRQIHRFALEFEPPVLDNARTTVEMQVVPPAGDSHRRQLQPFEPHFPVLRGALILHNSYPRTVRLARTSGLQGTGEWLRR